MTQNRKLIRILAILTAFSLFAAGCGTGPAATEDNTQAAPVADNGSFHAEGQVVPVQYTTLSFYPTGGRVAELLVEEGQIVQAGDELMRLGELEALQAELASARQAETDAKIQLQDLEDTADLERDQAGKAWRDAQKELLDAQVIFNDLNDQEYQDDLGDLEEDVQDAKEDLDDEQEDLDRYMSLDPSSDKRKNAQEDYDEQLQDYLDAVYERDLKIYELDAARANVEAATTQVADAERRYNDRADGPDPDELTRAQAGLDAAVARRQSAERTMQNATLTAPFAGVVVDLFHLTPGTLVSAGQSAAQLADLSQLYVETKDLTELDIVDVQVGDAVAISADALPGQQFTGTVTAVKQVSGDYSGDVVYTVRIQLNDPPSELRWGMTVDVTFSTAE